MSDFDFHLHTILFSCEFTNAFDTLELDFSPLFLFMDTLVRPVVWILSLALLVVGLLGFVMPSPLLGLFEVDMLHNLIHIVSGAVGLVAVNMGHFPARMYLILFGLVYLVVAVVGYVQQTTVLGFIGVNMADNMLHAGIAALCLVVGFGARK